MPDALSIASSRRRIDNLSVWPMFQLFNSTLLESDRAARGRSLLIKKKIVRSLHLFFQSHFSSFSWESFVRCEQKQIVCINSFSCSFSALLISDNYVGGAPKSCLLVERPDYFRLERDISSVFFPPQRGEDLTWHLWSYG